MSSTAGLRDVIAGTTSICTLDGIAGELSYRGIPIEELAEHATFEEVAYLLWHGRLPNRAELTELEESLRSQAALPEPVLALLRSFPTSAKPMDVLRTTVSALGMWDPDGNDNSLEANQRKAIRLTAQIPTITTTFNRLRNGQEPIAPRTDLSVAGNFLYTLTGQEPTPVATRTLDMALVLHADHEFNASTFSARVTIATLTDMYSAITSAIGTLAGPLHGGANEAVFRMLEEVGSVDNVEPYVSRVLGTKGGRVMGFGHAVYKTKDPRAFQLQKMAQVLAEESGNPHLYQISVAIEELMLRTKNIKPNVDFYSATVYHVLGIPTDLFTLVFAASRVTGWSAHVLEQLANNRIIRPRGEYIGPVDQHYVPIEER